MCSCFTIPVIYGKIRDGASYPIGSMYAIYGNIYHQYTPNVSIYIPYMDPMGIALRTLRTGTTNIALGLGESATKILHNGSHGRFQVILRESQAI